MPTLAKRLFDSCPTDACLTRAGRINFNDYSRSFFRFRAQFIDKGSPSSVIDLFREPTPSKPANVQVFNRNKSEVLNNCPTKFVMKVGALTAHSLMRSPEQLNCFPSPMAPLVSPRYLSTGNTQRTLARFVITWIVDCRSIGEYRERRKTHVKSGRFIARRERGCFANDIKKRKPPFSLPPYNQSLYLALNRAVQLDSHGADLREMQLVSVQRLPNLPKGDAVIAKAGPETGITSTFAALDSAKETLESKLDTLQNIFQNLRVDLRYVCAVFPNMFQLQVLIKPGDPLSLQAPCFAPLLQRGIVKLATHSELTVKYPLLAFSRVNTIAKGLNQDGPILTDDQAV